MFVFGENQEVTIKVKKKDALLDLFGIMPPKGNNDSMQWEEIKKLAREEKVASNENQN
jgi:antitoxin PrlF